MAGIHHDCPPSGVLPMVLRKIAFVSCAYATYRPHQPAWTAIRAARPDLLLMLGDNAYMNWWETDWNFPALEACYRAQFEGTGQGMDDFRALIQRTPTMAVWDDHDCGPNDTMGGAPGTDPAHLRRARDLFNHWMGFARNNNADGHMYCTWDDFPELRVLMLDGRTWRTRPTADGATVLGKDQERWLRDRLTQDPQRRITIVATGSAFGRPDPEQEGHVVADYTRFARDLRGLLAFRPGDGTEKDLGRRALYLGGDVHANAFRSRSDGWHEAISSGVACFRRGTEEHASQAPESAQIDHWGLITVTDRHVHIDLHERLSGADTFMRRSIDIDTWRVLATPVFEAGEGMPA